MTTPDIGDDDTVSLGWRQVIMNHHGTKTDRRNQYRFLAWCLAWAVSFVAATWILRPAPGVEGAGAWALAIGPSLLGAGALLAYLRFLRQADELLRRIQLEGLALGFAVGLIFTLGYQLLERVGAPSLPAGVTAVVMLVAWAGGEIAATMRYR